MTINTINPGVDTQLSSKLNTNFGAFVPAQLSTSTALSLSVDKSGGATSDSGTLDFVIPANVITDYLKLDITISFGARASIGSSGTFNSASAGLTASVVSGSDIYSAVTPAYAYVYDNSGGDQNDTDRSVGTISFYYEPTSSEKTSGFTVRLTTNVSVSGDGANTSLCSASTSHIQSAVFYL